MLVYSKSLFLALAHVRVLLLSRSWLDDIGILDEIIGNFDWEALGFWI